MYKTLELLSASLCHILGLFFLISGYGTNVVNVFITGVIFTLLFTMIFFFSCRKHNHFIRIKKELILKFRLGETPIISADEDPMLEINEGQKKRPKNFFKKNILLLLSFFKTITFTFIFFINVLMKVGFGNIRLKKNTPKKLKYIAWAAWVFGYTWYVILVYTLVVIPFLKGLF